MCAAVNFFLARKEKKTRPPIAKLPHSIVRAPISVALLPAYSIMGVGRRMRKQGPPPPLDESLVTRKRKAVPEEVNGHGKKRRASDSSSRAKQNTAVDVNGKSTESKAQLQDRKKKVAENLNGKRAKQENITHKATPQKLKRKSVTDEDEAGDEEILSDFASNIDDELDGVQVGKLDALGSDLDEDNDEFDESGSDVLDSEEEDRRAMFSDDDSDAEEQLTAANIAGLSRRLDMEKAEEAAIAQEELEEAALQTNIAGDRPNILQDEDEDEEGMAAVSRLAPDLQLLRTRISDTIRVLDDFANLKEQGRSRAEYTSQLLKDICAYYGYSPYLAEKLYSLFPPSEAFAFFEANETPRPIVIRTNTLRTSRRTLAQSLINRGVTLEPVGKWSKVGLQVFESQVPLGATPEYLAGHYILQAASSFLPVMALAPQENERILDMAAAPGGKTTYISALMRNTGCVFANDANKSRAKGLIGNIHRLGVKNTIVCNYDALEFPKVIGGFDRVLLDAPCSGTGVISKDASVKTNKTDKDFLRLPHLQKRLLLAAIDSVDHASKTGGYIVYSTCSITVEENEGVVAYALSRRPNVKLVPTGLTFGKEGFTNYMGKKFHASLKETRRYYPHSYNVDGFYVAKFMKTGPTPPNAVDPNGHVGVGAGKAQATDDEIVDRTPVIDDEKEEEDDFGGWDSDEDQAYMERAQRAALRRQGKNPKATKSSGMVRNEQPSSTRPQDPKVLKKSSKSSTSNTNGTEKKVKKGKK